MVRTASRLWIGVGLLILTGCKDKPATPPKIEANQEVKADPAANLPVAGNLAEQLTTEAAARSKDGLKVEAVLDALAKGGVTVTDTRQYIGRTVFATYCFGGITSKVIALTVCEYGTEDAVKSALERSEKLYGVSPLRTMTVNKLTVLSLVRPTDAEEGKVEADKAIQIFSKL